MVPVPLTALAFMLLAPPCKSKRDDSKKTKERENLKVRARDEEFNPKSSRGETDRSCSKNDGRSSRILETHAGLYRGEVKEDEKKEEIDEQIKELSFATNLVGKRCVIKKHRPARASDPQLHQV